MKQYIKEIIGSIYYPLFRKYQKNIGNRVLLYHAIGTNLEHDSYGISISEKNFLEHIKHLKEKYEIIPLDENYKNNLNRETISITFDDGYKDNLIALDICEKYEIPFTLYITTGMIGKKDYLNESEIKIFAKSPFCRLGTHSVSHPLLSQLTFDEQYHELNDSKKALEDIISKEIIEMSYPHGSYNNETIKITDELGYNLISSSHIGLNTNKNLDLKRIKRIEIVASDNLEKLDKKISGYYDYLKYRE